ncbi:Rrf2 family transcriptional regulator [Rhodopirellula sp. MGV]|uniref:Rrf2 family transcriptional regulator n=1 Tax=Rhodopirellula sp. MGV TaxID=2023130 RepID=UPI000B968EC9|nr:Rrf2 family transcriptional regulator [Rhodopirellula sp. MGV]OYP33889.1 Rrf2 family transcriptional regulator [Rhodopirellula sp. MGV]PNY34154.1 Rrf2 family transcriptional regulator [Rhodopirellula baltica]PNY38000.1 Rrf2 family transcriptional regulator [Rhodopirellula baltica]
MLSKTAEYALRSVVCLANRRGEAASADKLAAETKVPRRYLTRVLQDLAAGGLVGSRPGPGGGYVLSKPIAEVTILDVVNLVDPIERIRQCPLGLKTHHTLCPLHAELDRAYAQAEQAFGNVTLEDLLNSTTSVIPLCESISE